MMNSHLLQRQAMKFTALLDAHTLAAVSGADPTPIGQWFPEKAVRIPVPTGNVLLEILDLTYFEKGSTSYSFGITEKSMTLLGIQEEVVEAVVQRLLVTNELMPSTLAVDLNNGTEEVVKYLTLEKAIEVVVAMARTDANFRPMEIMQAAGVSSFTYHLLVAATDYYTGAVMGTW